MSDQLYHKKSVEIKEFKLKEETQNKRQISSAPQLGFKEKESTDVSDEIAKMQADFKVTDVQNIPSNIAMDRLKKIEEGKDVVVDTRYIDNEQGYQEKFATENLESLRSEFQENRYKKKGFLWGYRSDSGEMKAIQDKLSELTTNMYERRFSLSDSAAFEEVFQMYRNIIKDCNTYLGSSTKGYSKIGKLRRSMVERIRTTCMRELNILPQIIDSERESQKASKNESPISFRDLLRKARSVQLGDDKNKYDIIGASQSTIIKYKQGDKSYFFKKDDINIKHNNETIINTLKEEQKTLISIGKLNEKDCEEVAGHTKNLLVALDEDVKNGVISEQLKGHIFDAFEYAFVEKEYVDAYNIVKTNEEKEAIYNSANRALETVLVRSLGNNFANLFNMGGDCHFLTYLKNNVVRDMLSSQTRLDAYEQSFNVVKKTAFSSLFLSKAVKLPIGAKITTNNVATSRLAEKLKVSDIVAKSQSAIININGKTLVGNIMEEAKGKALNEVNPVNDALYRRIDNLGTLRSEYLKSVFIIDSWKKPMKALIRKNFRKAIMKHKDTLKDYNIEAALKNYKEMYELALKIPGYDEIPHINAYVEVFKEYENAIENGKKYEKQILEEVEKNPEKYKVVLENIEKDKEDKKEKKPTVPEILKSYNKIQGMSEKFGTYYSGNAKKQLMCLGILDFIMGQIDRHQGNFLVTTEEIDYKIVITGVKAIDNDACCGLLKPKDLTNKKTVNRLGRLKDEKGNVLVPYMDTEFALNVMNLTVEELTHEMIDLLSKEQIDAMAERLKYVQEMIRTEYNKRGDKTNTIKFIGGKDWDKVGVTVGDQSSLPKYNSLFFQESLKLADDI